MKPTVLAEAILEELKAYELATEHDCVVLERRRDGQLWASKSGEERPVFVRRCFPWSEPTEFVSLRDGDENEFVLVRGTADLDEASREVLEQALAEAGFVLEVTRIDSVDEEIEIRNWKVETRQGARSFQTRLDDWPRQVSNGSTLIRDVAGDLYYVRNPARLDKKSRDLLWAFVD